MQVQGKRGYIPKRLVREVRIFRKPTIQVATELNLAPTKDSNSREENPTPEKTSSANVETHHDAEIPAKSSVQTPPAASTVTKEGKEMLENVLNGAEKASVGEIIPNEDDQSDDESITEK